MPHWIVNLLLVFATLSSAWAFWLSIRFQWESKSNLVIDWGPQPKRVRNWVFVVVVAWGAWYFWKTALLNQLFFQLLAITLLAITNGLVTIRVALETFRHLGIYKDGMLVFTQILWTTRGTFIRWSEIQKYHWEEQGRLIINPGWTPIICQISEERIVDTKAALKEKCPDAELEIQRVMP